MQSGICFFFFIVLLSDPSLLDNNDDDEGYMFYKQPQFPNNTSDIVYKMLLY